ncbi:MAG: aminomethyl-transferring glycine dehydrogenase subunit GcvPB [Mariprofundales bacterium]
MAAISGLMHEEDLIFEIAHNDEHDISIPSFGDQSVELDVGLAAFIRDDVAQIPGLSEPEVVRHYVRLSQWNHHIESGFYPLGSCTMKYNPRVHEKLAALSGFALTHPYQPDDSVQGLLGLLFDVQTWLGEISGLPHVSLQPAAGAHGELVGMMMIHAYHQSRNDHKRLRVLIPDSAHGTNPASAVLAGLKPVEIASAANGRIDLEILKAALNDDVAAIMLTNPNTAGVFESDIIEICAMVHAAGALVYGDGANLNALVGLARPGDMGIDCLHINVHKTFSTPHGGGGPGAGPIAVNDTLAAFLPVPQLKKDAQEHDKFVLINNTKQTIGAMLGSIGQVGVLLRTAAYIAAFGKQHLHKIAEDAVLNASYIRARLQEKYHLPFSELCKHEVLFTDAKQQAQGISTMDIAKRLIDLGFHPMTVYFPLIVHGAMLIEPTETESKATIDDFCDAMLSIAQDIEAGNTDVLHAAPKIPVRNRVDETMAARKPVLAWPLQLSHE